MRTLLVLALSLGAIAQTDEPEPELVALRQFVAWLEDYEEGAIRLMRDLAPDPAELRRADEVMAGLASWDNLDAAKKLFEAAVVNPNPPGVRSSTDQIDFHAELQPWKVREMARRHIASIADPAVEDWLLRMLASPNLRGNSDHPDRIRAEAALQTLGLLDSPRARIGLLEASASLPAKLRLRAIDVLSRTAEPGTVDHFVDLLRDREPDMRIAALNAIGTTLGPHTDETVHAEIPAEIAALRDRAIARMKTVLLRDRTWQVRAACAHNLALLKCRAVIPVLIAGLKAELGRKKDPWAMDIRLHRILEGMTGTAMPPGNARGWEAFWREVGPGFRLAKPGDIAGQTAGDRRYQRFFSLDLESDALLFLVDFSGSMKEQIVLRTETTTTRPGEAISKAQLVVDQLKKIILSLPDGSVFNIVVFSDDVRVWRPDRNGAPAMVKLDENTRDHLLGSFLDNLHPQGPTNLHGALDTALHFAGDGVRDKHYAVAYDTIYILSDGAPTWGEVTDRDEIRRLVREANRLKRMTIHAITFGKLNDVKFLKALAEENGGRHIHVQ